MYGPGTGGGGKGGGGDYGKGGGGRGGGGRERQMTPRGGMSGGANQRPPLTDLPNHMKAMFEPRAPIPHGQPVPDKNPTPYTGISQYLDMFEKVPPPVRVLQELPKERKARMAVERDALNAEKNELLMQDWDPKKNYKATANAFSTLFVARLSYETTDRKLKRELEQYGAVKDVKIVTDTEGRPRGYAFVEFEREDDMAEAYKRANGRKIDGRRVVVDVERGRTVKGWRPRRFGGGLGGRKAKKSKKELALDEIRNAASFAAATAASSAAADEDRRRRDDERKRRESDRDSDRGRGGDRDSDRSRGGDRDRGRDSGRERERERSRDRGRDRGGRSDRGGGGDAPSYYGPSGGGDRSRDSGRSDRKRSRDRSPGQSSSRRRY